MRTLAEKFLERLRQAVVENDAELGESIAKSGNVLLPFRFSPELRLNTTGEKTKNSLRNFQKSPRDCAGVPKQSRAGSAYLYHRPRSRGIRLYEQSSR